MYEIRTSNGTKLCRFTNMEKANNFARTHVLLNVYRYEIEVNFLTYWFYKLIGH